MDRLFAWFLFAMVLYHLIRGDHETHQALAPVRSGSHGKAKEEFDD